MSTPAADRPTQSPEQAHGSRVGDLRIRQHMAVGVVGHHLDVLDLVAQQTPLDDVLFELLEVRLDDSRVEFEANAARVSVTMSDSSEARAASAIERSSSLAASIASPISRSS